MAGIQPKKKEIFLFLSMNVLKHILCNTYNLTRRHDVTMDRGEYDLIFRKWVAKALPRIFHFSIYKKKGKMCIEA